MCLSLWVSIFACLTVLQSKSKNLSKSVFESLSLCVLEFSSLSLRMSLSLWICLFESLNLHLWVLNLLLDRSWDPSATNNLWSWSCLPRPDLISRLKVFVFGFAWSMMHTNTHFCILITAVPLILTRATTEGRSVTPNWTSTSGDGIDQSSQKIRLNSKAKACGLSQRLALAQTWNSCILKQTKPNCSS